MAKKSTKELVDEMLEDIDDVTNPVGQRIPQDEAVVQTVRPNALRAVQRTAAERQQAEEQYAASRLAREQEAIAISRYINAHRRNTIMEGVVGGVDVIDKHVFWLIYDGPVVVMIPFRDAMPSLDSGEEDTTATVVRQRQLLTKALGAKIAFTVEHMEPGEDGTVSVYGSRREAMERIKKRHFGARPSQPVKVGDRVIGTFLTIGAHAAWVSVCGLDLRIPKNRLSHRYMEKATMEFAPGEEIELAVMEKDEETGEITEVSALPAELDACALRMQRARRGSRFTAIIITQTAKTGIDSRTQQPTKYYVASLWVEGLEVPAFATMNVLTNKRDENAYTGDRVTVEVEELADNGYLRCRIISFHR